MLLDATTRLPDGLRVRVRLPQALDRVGLRLLHERLGLVAADLDIARTLRFDPRFGTVACATAWIGGGETLVGYGAIDHGAGAPRLLIGDEVCAPGVSEALATALVDHAAGRTAA